MRHKENTLILFLTLFLSVLLFPNQAYAKSLNLQILQENFESYHVTINIEKRDEETEATLDGAEFGIFNRDSFESDSGDVILKKGSKISVITSLDGVATFSDSLPFGKYYIRELEAPDGYYLNDDILNLTVSYENMYGNYTFYDKKIPETEKEKKENQTTVSTNGNVDVNGSVPLLSIGGGLIPYQLNTILNSTGYTLNNYSLSITFPKDSYLQSINTGVYNSSVPFNVYYKEKGTSDWMLWQGNVASTTSTALDSFTLSTVSGRPVYIESVLIDYGNVPHGFNCTTPVSYNVKSPDNSVINTTYVNTATLSGWNNNKLYSDSVTLQSRASTNGSISGNIPSGIMTPKTGDNSMIILYISIILFCFIAILFIIRDLRKKNVLQNKKIKRCSFVSHSPITTETTMDVSLNLPLSKPKMNFDVPLFPEKLEVSEDET